MIADAPVRLLSRSLAEVRPTARRKLVRPAGRAASSRSRDRRAARSPARKIAAAALGGRKGDQSLGPGGGPAGISSGSGAVTAGVAAGLTRGGCPRAKGIGQNGGWSRFGGWQRARVGKPALAPAPGRSPQPGRLYTAAVSSVTTKPTGRSRPEARRGWWANGRPFPIAPRADCRLVATGKSSHRAGPRHRCRRRGLEDEPTVRQGQGNTSSAVVEYELPHREAGRTNRPQLGLPARVWEIAMRGKDQREFRGGRTCLVTGGRARTQDGPQETRRETTGPSGTGGQERVRGQSAGCSESTVPPVRAEVAQRAGPGDGAAPRSLGGTPGRGGRGRRTKVGALAKVAAAASGW